MTTTTPTAPTPPKNWCEFADKRRPDLLGRLEAYGAYFVELAPWTMRVEFEFADPDDESVLYDAPQEGVQWVIRTYTSGSAAGTGLLWWEPAGTPLATPEDGGREPPDNALAIQDPRRLDREIERGLDQEH